MNIGLVYLKGAARCHTNNATLLPTDQQQLLRIRTVNALGRTYFCLYHGLPTEWLKLD